MDKVPLAAGLNIAPDKEPLPTDGWTSYKACKRSIGQFLTHVTVRGSDVWIEGVCFGSRGEPYFGVPVEPNRVESNPVVRLDRAITRAAELLHAVSASLHGALSAGDHTIEEFRNKGVDESSLTCVIARNARLLDLQKQLVAASGESHVEVHPAVLRRWRDILADRFELGFDDSDAVRVTVTVVSDYFL
jgi:hypothetical protein